jgi:hypothetical protein
MAKVYVFNCYHEPVTGLSVGGHAAGDIPGYADGSAPPPPIYTPASLAVPRSKGQESSATFAIGPNTLLVPWDSFRGQATIAVPDPAKQHISLADPLLLFLAVNDAILLTTRGYVVQQFPMTLTNSVGGLVEATL